MIEPSSTIASVRRRRLVGVAVAWALMAMLPVGPRAASRARESQGEPAPAARPWVDLARYGDLLFVAQTDPSRIERYDIAGDAWLTPIALPEPPTAVAAGESGLWVGTASRLLHARLDGSELGHVRNLRYQALDIELARDAVLVLGRGRLYRFAATTLTLEAQFAVNDIGERTDLAVDPAGERCAVREPYSLLIYDCRADGGGNLVANSAVQALADEPGLAPRLAYDPSGQVLTVDEGLQVTAAGGFLRRLEGGPFRDLVEAGDLWYTLGASRLERFAAAMESGDASAQDGDWRGMFALGPELLLVGMPVVAGRPNLRRLAVATMFPGPPGIRPDPANAAFTADQAAAGSDGTLYLLSRRFGAVFRWSAAANRFLSSIALEESLTGIATDPVEPLLYLATAQGRVLRWDARRPEEPPLLRFAIEPPPRCLASLGAYLAACGDGGTLRVYDATSGRLAGELSGMTNGRLVAAADGRLYQQEDFMFGTVRVFSAQFDASSQQLVAGPVTDTGSNRRALAPDRGGRRILVGSGDLIEMSGDMVRRVDELPHEVDAAAATADGWATLREEPDGQISLERWGPRLAPVARRSLGAGRVTDLWVLPGSDEVVVLLDRQERPWLGRYRGADLAELATMPPPKRPVNDDIAGALAMDPAVPTLAFDSGLASLEDGEIASDCMSVIGHSLWFSLTATRAGVYRLHARANSFTPELAAFTGTTHPLTQLACLRRILPADDYSLDLSLRAGERVLIRVDGSKTVDNQLRPAGGRGQLGLGFTPSPPNDDVSQAESIADLPHILEGNVASATNEDRESTQCGWMGGLWYRYQAASNGMLSISGTASPKQMIVSAWSGTRHPLKALACAEVGPNVTTRLEMPVGRDQVVLIRVSPSSYDLDQPFRLSVSAPNLGLNDDLAGALNVRAPYSGTFATQTAGTEPRERGPWCVPTAGHGLWFRYLPAGPEILRVDTSGSSYDTVLSIWTGSAHPLEQLACNDDADDDQRAARLVTRVDGGQPYWIKAEGFGNEAGLLSIAVAVSAVADELALPRVGGVAGVGLR